MDLLLLAAGSYLLGAVPFSHLVAGKVAGRDVRREGTGNVGATNVSRVAGFRAGALAGALDALKGAVAAAIAFWAGPAPLGPHLAGLLCGGCAVLGHDFPVFLRFRGGKGGAPAIGALTVVLPGPMMLVAATWAALFALGTLLARGSRFALSLGALASLPAWAAARGYPVPVLLGATGILLLLLVRIASARETPRA